MTHEHEVTILLASLGAPNEAKVRRAVRRQGYRLCKRRGGYTLIDERQNAAMYHATNVGLEDIVSFLRTKCN